MYSKRQQHVRFTKMQGAGNDYVYIDCFREQVKDAGALAKKVSNRHFGIGSDGLVLIMPSEECDFRMRMFNTDGSEAEMCGNASRCIGKYVYERGLTTKKDLTLETKAGVKHLQLFTAAGGKVDKVCVDMGEPVLDPAAIPVNKAGKSVVDEPFSVASRHFRITCVSMGNPHTVVFVEEKPDEEWMNLGYLIENHTLFPCRTNVEFVHVLSSEEMEMRVWERGAGETLACGTGACAVLVAAVLNNLTKRKALIRLPGGDLEVEWRGQDNRVYMTGNAEIVFDGEFYI
ncbi:diaminopimelate epimerase [Parabacteroides pacaensis]|uniref:diaminopimelate epimerase n=1 Tax=Parabacteroides pacaensis TaxID=2086575 RepID=UPI000D109E6A|nr:diaminopimelate epimerase [Parabacteroides pacaensis]